MPLWQNDTMKLSNIGEFGLIRAIQKLSFQSSPDMMIGIGDDAAVLKIAPTTLLLASTDMLIEGVHFDLTYHGLLFAGMEIRSDKSERHSGDGRKAQILPHLARYSPHTFPLRR